ncbi:MAG: hypothetical protein U5N26_00445 [Candidatus Marinimicrobia bacterium]|nr:hypothetical protein [Candidatus Neomarinimicrobiota bacterium]
MLNIRHICDLNAQALKGKQMRTVHLYEALHEKKIAQIADIISRRPEVPFHLYCRSLGFRKDHVHETAFDPASH